MGKKKFTKEQYTEALDLLRRGGDYEAASEKTGVSVSMLRKKYPAHNIGRMVHLWVYPNLAEWAVAHDYRVKDFAGDLNLNYGRTHARLTGMAAFRKEEILRLEQLTGMDAGHILERGLVI